MDSKTYPDLPILMADDEDHLLIGFDTVLRSNGINNIISCRDSRDIMAILARQPIALMLLDLIMPHVSGEEILDRVHRDFPQIPIVVITGVDNVDTAVKCIKAGAFDYLVKPVEENRLLTTVQRALDFEELRRENASLKTHILSDRLKHPEAFKPIVTTHKSMSAIFHYAEAIADSPMPILITGETGVGKELLVDAIHTISACKGELVKINVAGLDDTMFSDTLFGHVKGAFTGAGRARAGLIKSASGGTLFLDEIGDLSHPSQVKLLRLLQAREYFAIGADTPQHTDARIIVATNHNLQELQQSGRFRKDLYYRLGTHHIYIPALRERIDDVPLLMEHFLAQASAALGRKIPTVPPELFVLLSTYAFPGNIRELQSMIFDAVSRHRSGKLSMTVFKANIWEETCSNRIDSKADQPHGAIFSECGSLPTLKEAAQSLIAEAMRRSKGNQSIAAHLLGISRQALNRRLKSMPDLATDGCNGETFHDAARN